MDFKAYQEFANTTKIYPDNMKIVYPCLGLSGEIGEVCEKIKKVYRDKQGIFSDFDKDEICKEIGDVLWYLANIATDLDRDLNDIAFKNLEKIEKRKRLNIINGNGDNR